MARKKSLGYPHYIEVVKLTMVFATLLVVFAFSFSFMFGVGRLGFADAARGGVKGRPTNPGPPVRPLPTDDPVACIDIYQPVCGVDGNTYSNECVATAQNGVAVECSGECPCGSGGDNNDTPILEVYPI